MDLNLKITKLNNYSALLTKGIKPNVFVISRNSYLKFRVGRLEPEGLAYCYRKDENNEIEHQFFYPCEIDLIEEV